MFGGSERVRAAVASFERARAELVAAVGEWDADREWAADGALTGASWLRACTPMSSAEASVLVREARLVRAHEATRAALAEGRLSTAHLRVLAAVRRWRSLADDVLAQNDAAARHRRRFLHTSTTQFGTVRLDGELARDGDGKIVHRPPGSHWVLAA